MKRMQGCLWLLLAAPLAGEEAWHPLSLGEDLACSACGLFIDVYLSKCSHYLYGAGKAELDAHTSVLSVYEARLMALYEEFDPPMTKGVKRKKVKELLGKEAKKGLFPARKLHEVYSELCKRYGVEPQEIYEGEVAKGSPEEQRLRLTKAALSAALSHVNAKGQQWATTGEAPHRKYVDFNKAMEGGTAESISSGGDIAENILKTFTFLATNHNETLTVSPSRSLDVHDDCVDRIAAHLPSAFCRTPGGRCQRFKGVRL